VRTTVLSSLIEMLLSSPDGLWKLNSQALYTLRTTENVALPRAVNQSPADSQANKFFQARSYAAGFAMLLLLYHAKLPSPITPIMLAVALLPTESRASIATPSFLKMLFDKPNDRVFIQILEKSTPSEPMSQELCPYMEAAGINVSPK